MRTVGADTAGQLQTVDLYTSHEGLLLEYEQSLTRKLENPPNYTSSRAESPSDGKAYYNTSAHFLWVGDRTRQIDGAHIEYFRGIENPIGVKIGPTTSSSDLLALLRILNPSVEVGKITLITRYGASKVRELLPTHIRVVENSEYARSVGKFPPFLFQSILHLGRDSFQSASSHPLHLLIIHTTPFLRLLFTASLHLRFLVCLPPASPASKNPGHKLTSDTSLAMRSNAWQHKIYLNRYQDQTIH